MVGRELTSKPGNKGKRVLMAVENQQYPQDLRVRQEALALTAAGYDVSVMCPGGKGQPSREEMDGVHIYRYPAPPPGENLFGYVVEYGYSLLSMMVLSLLISIRPGFDYLHTANPPDTTVLIGALYKLFGKRFIFDHHDLSPEMYRARFDGKGSPVVYKTLRLFEKLSCKMADHVITTNNSYKQLDCERNQVPEERISVVRNGPSMKMLQPIEPDHELRQKAPFIIVYIGAIAAQDGLDYLIRAFHHLAVDLGRKNDFHCYILGSGTSLASIQTLANSLHLEDNITFTGWLTGDKVKRYISSADLGVDPDPSNEYNDRCTMIKMMEYMAHGKPIVAFDLPEHRNSAAEAALYARPNDELDFARQIAKLMDDPQLRQCMGCAGKERVRESLAWEHQVQHLLKAYQAISFKPTATDLEGS